MKLKSTLTLALIACGLCSITQVSAQTSSTTNYNYNPSAYIMPSLNWQNIDDGLGSDHKGGGVGLRWGKPIAPHWDLQFGPNYGRTRDGSFRYQQTTLGLDALWMISRADPFQPFLLFGAGVERDKVNIPNSELEETSPYINAGLGFQYKFSDQWGMQADYRRVRGYLHNDDFGIRHANNNYINVGLTYAFDKPAPRVVAQAARAPEPAPYVAPPPPPPPAPRFERMTMSSTELFAFNSSVLMPTQGKLDEIADALNKNPQLGNIVINGYTDRIGSDNYNLKLSQRRADAVRTYLIGKGVDGGRLTAVGKGKSDPVVTCTDKKRSDLIKCLEPNRRVEISQITVERRVQ